VANDGAMARKVYPERRVNATPERLNLSVQFRAGHGLPVIAFLPPAFDTSTPAGQPRYGYRLTLALLFSVLVIAGCSDDESTVAPPGSNPSTDRYVNQATGDDANNGSSGSPWATISYAVATADSEVTIHVAPGTYDAAGGETFPITMKNGQTLLGDLANQGAGATPTLIRGEAPLTFGPMEGTTMVGARDARVAGFSIRTENNTGFYTGIVVDGVDMEIDNNTFLAESYAGVTSGNGANVDAHDNLIQSQTYGLFLDGSGIVSVHDNTMAGNFGLRCYGIDSLDVANNVIGTTNVGVQWGSGTAGVVRDNTFNGSAFNNGGILIYSQNLVVRRNTFLAGPGVHNRCRCRQAPSQVLGKRLLRHRGRGTGHNGSGDRDDRNTWANNPPQVGVDILITSTGSVVTE
jgi:hypothetical protein